MGRGAMKIEDKAQVRAKVIQMYRQGCSVSDMVAMYNISQATVYRYLAWITKDRKLGRKPKVT